MRKLTALTVVVLAMFGGYGTSAAHAKNERGTAAFKCPGHVQGVYHYRGVTRHWERKLGHKPSRSNFNASKVRSCKYTLWVAKHWHHRAVVTRKAYIEYQKALAREAAKRAAAAYSTWECIHSYEGAWNSNTGNGYYGGLQMDWGFMRTYGSEFVKQWGSADNWPVSAQITAATRARDGYGHYRGRGYTPWPNTARACGLL